MSDRLKLTGPGAIYPRVSSSKQDTDAQLQAVGAFLDKAGAAVPPERRYEDIAWPRDVDRERPEFNRLLGDARRGLFAWVVVQALDRFAAKNSRRLLGYIDDLAEAGVKLYDCDGKEWTAEDDATDIQAWVGGSTSSREQKAKSRRALDGMVAAAKAGAWLGAPPKFALDVGCFDRATGAFLYRVVHERREDTGGLCVRRGKARPVYRMYRRKVYADGREERFDGPGTFRPGDEQTLHLVPSADPGRRQALRTLFERYAAEAVSFRQLALWLNGLGYRNSCGNPFQGRDVADILADKVYLGLPTFGKGRRGRFLQYAGGDLVAVPKEERGRYRTSAAADVITPPAAVFEPLVPADVWERVRVKLGTPQPRPLARDPGMYFAGVLVCGGCGAPLCARKERGEYYCGSWHKHRCAGTPAASPCERNAVRHDRVEEYLGRFLEETGRRLEILAAPQQPGSAGAREVQGGWDDFQAGVARVAEYLRATHPEDYDRILAADAEAARWEDEVRADQEAHGGKAEPGGLARKYGKTLDDAIRKHAGDPTLTHFVHGRQKDFVNAVLGAYERHYDPAALGEALEGLEREHTRLMKAYADLPTPRAKDKAKAELEALESCIAGLEGHRANLAGAVRRRYEELLHLQRAVAEAREALRDGPAAQRRRAEAVRALLGQVEVTFVPTGYRGPPAPGKPRSRLVQIRFVPHTGDPKDYRLGRAHAGP
jgi:DNA invertase Pin-like site-specific DNA recombinase